MDEYAGEDFEFDAPEEENPDEPEERVEYEESAGNLVDIFESTKMGADALRTIVDDCKAKFDSAWDSTEEYRQRVAQDWKLFCGDLKPKSFPFQNCANGNIPIFMENGLRLVARMEGELFDDWTSVVGVVPLGTADEGVAEAMSKHDNWQLTEDIPNFVREASRMVMNFVLPGDVTVESYYDDIRGHNRHEVLTPDEFVIPYTIKTTMPDYSDVPYKCKVLHLYRHELQMRDGTWSNIDELLERTDASFEDDPDSPIREATAELHGEQVPDDIAGHSLAPFKIIHFEGWCSYLPHQKRDRYIKCLFDYQTGIALRLNIHEEVPWKERVRQRDMKTERRQYLDNLQKAVDLRNDQQRRRSEVVGNALRESWSPEEQQMALQAVPDIQIPDPPLPGWMDAPDSDVPPPKSMPINMFSHGVNIEPPMGGLGVGYGRVLGDLQIAVNTMFNQWADAATVSNVPPLFTTFDVEDTGMAPGKLTKVRAMGEKLAEGFFQPQVRGANPELVQAVQMLMTSASAAVQAPDVLSGAPGKSGETYRGISSRIEQATKQLSTMGRKFSMTVFKQVLMNNARLNSIFLDEHQMRRVLNPLTKQYETLEIKRSMYDRDYRVIMRADLRFTSEAQKQQEAMEMMQMPANMPVLQHNFAFQHETISQFLKAKKRPELIALLGAKPPPPQVFGPPAPPPGAPPGAPMPGGGGPPPGGGGPPPEGGMP